MYYRSVSKADARELLDTFGSLKKVSEASVDHLNLCSGFGFQKAKRVHEAFRTPFLVDNKNKRDEDFSDDEDLL